MQEVEGRLKQKVVSVAADLSLPPALQERVETGGQSAPAYGEQRSNKSKQVRIIRLWLVRLNQEKRQRGNPRLPVGIFKFYGGK